MKPAKKLPPRKPRPLPRSPRAASTPRTDPTAGRAVRRADRKGKR